MEAPAPGVTPITRPTSAVQIVSHQCFIANRRPSQASAQVASFARATPSRLTTVSCSIITKASESAKRPIRSEEHTSELQSLMRISYAVFCLKKKKKKHMKHKE